MPRDSEARELPLMLAAQRARKSGPAALRLVLTGEWQGRKGESGRWFVDEASLDAWIAEQEGAKAGAR